MPKIILIAFLVIVLLFALYSIWRLHIDCRRFHSPDDLIWFRTKSDKISDTYDLVCDMCGKTIYKNVNQINYYRYKRYLMSEELK